MPASILIYLRSMHMCACGVCAHLAQLWQHDDKKYGRASRDWTRLAFLISKWRSILSEQATIYWHAVTVVIAVVVDNIQCNTDKDKAERNGKRRPRRRRRSKCTYAHTHTHTRTHTHRCIFTQLCAAQKRQISRLMKKPKGRWQSSCTQHSNACKDMPRK